MTEFIKNIKNDRDIILTEVHYLANDYTQYPETGELKGFDEVKVIKIAKEGFAISYRRIIEASEKDFLSILVSFDIIYEFIEAYENENYITEKQIFNLICNEPDFFINDCVARTSLIIAQISSQIGNNVPIISPAQLLVDADEEDEK